MKRNMMIVPLVALALKASCTGMKTVQNVAAADCPCIKTVLTINADSTYQLQQDYIDRKDGHDEASGVLQVLDGGVLMLVRPSSGDHTFYKVKDAQSIMMTDSLCNEAVGEMA